MSDVTENPVDNAPESSTIQTTFTVQEIRELLPHRYPFALVDRIIDYVPEKKAVGIKNVTINEPFFPGHIPPLPIMPGVLIVESMAQGCNIIDHPSPLTGATSRPPRAAFLASADTSQAKEGGTSLVF